ncbi:MAG: UvrD-helicase domain-containing protein [Chloroflexi bacterium]|nr:UvrD-helicase domain-containing protein [Chloroflexota bacterium]
MSVIWLTTMKPSFQTQWLALPPRESHQVLEKIALLAQDPKPDAKTKKQLKYMDGKLHRIRSGDYRIFYTFEEPYISLLSLDRRSDDTYEQEIEAEILGGLNPEIDKIASADTKSVQPDWERIFAKKSASEEKTEKRKLPEPITTELLKNLKVPQNYHARLVRLETEDALWNCPGVPDEILLQLWDCMFGKPLEQVVQQPDYLLGDVNDLLRYKEGELMGFLLKLSAEQEKFVNWAATAAGPTLVKGGPGTGKSTIALYRVRNLLTTLKKQGNVTPRILFTTYTNALVRSSEQLLRQLLGEDAKYVKVQTADSLAISILQEAKAPAQLAREDSAYLRLLQRAIGLARFEGNQLKRTAQKQAIDRLTDSYLLEEIGSVIVARLLPSLEAYLETPRPGRKIALAAIQRTAVWRVYEAFCELLQESNIETWQQARARASRLVAEGKGPKPFDGMLVDEAQDIDPSTLSMLVNLCQAPNRLFITADANQSIYGSGFNWSDVHQNLKFQGRTGILKANYRSTKEIGEAAHSYLNLTTFGLDSEPVEQKYINTGFTPAVRAVKNIADEVKLLARYLPGAARELLLTQGSCAVLCPYEQTGRELATRLTEQGVQATFMTGKDLDLTYPGVKVLTLKSSKGLEFPIVALAGFPESSYPRFTTNMSPEERDEILARERRTVFVAMTRAMRALLVIVPPQTKNLLLKDFNETYWNLGNEKAGANE